MKFKRFLVVAMLLFVALDLRSANRGSDSFFSFAWRAGARMFWGEDDLERDADRREGAECKEESRQRLAAFVKEIFAVQKAAEQQRLKWQTDLPKWGQKDEDALLQDGVMVEQGAAEYKQAAEEDRLRGEALKQVAQRRKLALQSVAAALRPPSPPPYDLALRLPSQDNDGLLPPLPVYEAAPPKYEESIAGFGLNKGNRSPK